MEWHLRMRISQEEIRLVTDEGVKIGLDAAAVGHQRGAESASCVFEQFEPAREDRYRQRMERGKADEAFFVRRA